MPMRTHAIGCDSFKELPCNCSILEHDYSNEPHSLSELRSIQESDSALQTPRDALISALRSIDSGEVKPNKLVIIFNNETETNTTYMIAGKGFAAILGMLLHALLLIREGRE